VRRASIVSGADTNVLRVPALCVGIGGEGCGALVLNPAVTNITVGALRLGGGNAADLGIVDLGTNSQLRSLTIADSLDYTYGGFRCYDGQGHCITGLPGHVAFRMGAPSQRAGVLSIADGGSVDPTVMELGQGIGTFEAYLTALRVAPTAIEGHHRHGTLDLRAATLVALDVDGPITIGGPSSHGKVYLPAGRVSCASLQLNATSAGHIPGDALLALSNTELKVAGDALLGDSGTMTAGVLTNDIHGMPSGLDICGTLTVTNGGAMHLSFAGPPVDASRAYWGLRMAGNRTNLLAALHAQGRLTWSMIGMTASQLDRFGIRYDAKRDCTYVGMEPLQADAVLFSFP